MKSVSTQVSASGASDEVSSTTGKSSFASSIYGQIEYSCTSSDSYLEVVGFLVSNMVHTSVAKYYILQYSE